jgi:hypothetical protein
MIHRKVLIATAITALVVITSCSDMTAPKKLPPGDLPVAAMSREHGDRDKRESRSGALHVTKECSQYTRLAGGFCTITSSNLKAIKVGTRVVYAVASGPTVLNSDVVLDPPGPGHSTAFGHVVLDLATGQGVVTISGGTGKFTWLRASVVVSRIDRTLRTWSWDGTYSFRRPHRHNDDRD